MTIVSASHTGTVRIVDHTPTQGTAMLFVTVNASGHVPPTASNAYHMLIVMVTKLVSVMKTGLEMIVACVCTPRRATQSVTNAMVAKDHLQRTVLNATITQSVTSMDTVSASTDMAETTADLAIQYVTRNRDAQAQNAQIVTHAMITRSPITTESVNARRDSTVKIAVLPDGVNLNPDHLHIGFRRA